ncbi:acetoacetate--CoA ligase [Paenarthrobacter sp. NPDC089316]|uniref:acetoacetate--CoA ligase n=1 Tax=unclassified Paenarthrobacter TaxID=2634190 RepID=UPI00342209ED
MSTFASRTEAASASPGQGTVMRPAYSGVQLSQTGIGKYAAWLADRGHRLQSYEDLWAWSIDDLEGFWASLWEYFDVPGSAGTHVLAERSMPGANWFPTARVNYAECILGRIKDPGQLAILGRSQTREPVELTFGELAEQVRRARLAFRSLGVRRGDFVVGYLPNVPEAVVAMLAAASLGAVWACCPPEFGARSVVDRIAQLRPKLLIAVSGYAYGAKQVDRTTELQTIREALPTVENVIGLSYGVHKVSDPDHDWSVLLEAQRSKEPLQFEPVSFDHPLWTLFSSGTTGLPKAVVHSHGGITLEHLKLHSFHYDTRSGDRVMLMATTGWTVWNAMVSGLMLGASIVLSDGNPHFPGLEEPWRSVADDGVTLFGTSPGFLSACLKEGMRPGENFDLSAMRMLSVTGAVLPPEVYDWLYEVLSADVYVNSQSGGTDICSNFVAGNPWLPVYRGEISGPCLGADVTAFDEKGQEITDQVGELVVRSPMPSMPVAFWNDKGAQRYREAYFDVYPRVWRHGDWVTVSARRSFVIQGRSDATLNRGGVRLGTAEYYNLVEGLPEIQDSLVVHLEDNTGGPGELMLFVVLAAGQEMSVEMANMLKSVIRKELSPRHVPDLVAAVPAVPRTLTGKKLETPIKKILAGARPEAVVSPGAVTDYDAIQAYVHALSQTG